MNMHIFQVESNKKVPTTGSLLIASPLLHDYHFSRSVIMIITHSEEGSMGLVLNKDFHHDILLNNLIPQLADAPIIIPVYKGGPVDRDTVFFIHDIPELEGSFDLKNGLYLNGDFEMLQSYILEKKVDDKRFRFFAGYAGWDSGQLEEEINTDSWIVSNKLPDHLFTSIRPALWANSLKDMGDPYRLWAKYPQYPSFN